MFWPALALTDQRFKQSIAGQKCFFFLYVNARVVRCQSITTVGFSRSDMLCVGVNATITRRRQVYWTPKPPSQPKAKPSKLDKSTQTLHLLLLFSPVKYAIFQGQWDSLIHLVHKVKKRKATLKCFALKSCKIDSYVDIGVNYHQMQALFLGWVNCLWKMTWNMCKHMYELHLPWAALAQLHLS